VLGVFPGLGKHAVIPVDVVWVEPELALLGVLFNGVGHFVSRQFHLGCTLLGDLTNEVEETIASEERDVVPCGDGGALSLLEDAELQRFGSPLAKSE
jgi:hypothetical protein